MRYLSLFSGIEAATVAWHPLGWEPVAFAEVAPFPSAVLAHRWPHVPNLGDITKVRWEDYRGAVDLVVGGSPCQSFSVAGLRRGLDDPRGNLALEYLRAVDRVRPRWVVWENVPGVLSSGGGRDFGAFLGALAELGYGFAYRVLDAQYVRVEPYPRAVPQRRRRVFVVGHLGDWRPPAAVLLERESVRGHTPPRRGTGEAAPADAGGRFAEADAPIVMAPAFSKRPMQQIATTDDGSCYALTTGGPPMVVSTLPIHDMATRYASKRGDRRDGRGNGLGIGDENDPCPTLTAGERHIVAAFSAGNSALAGSIGYAEGVSPTLRASASGTNMAPTIVGIDLYNNALTGDIHATITTAQGHHAPAVLESGMDAVVRRLTPLECERLQGFPDGYTQVPYRGRPADECPDGPRYAALGNSMAVNVMRWIGMRIACVELVLLSAVGSQERR